MSKKYSLQSLDFMLLLHIAYLLAEWHNSKKKIFELMMPNNSGCQDLCCIENICRFRIYSLRENIIFPTCFNNLRVNKEEAAFFTKLIFLSYDPLQVNQRHHKKSHLNTSGLI